MWSLPNRTLWKPLNTWSWNLRIIVCQCCQHFRVGLISLLSLQPTQQPCILYYLLLRYQILQDPLALRHDSSNVTLARYLYECLVTALYALCFLWQEWLAGHIRGFTTSLTAQSTAISLVTSESQERIKPVSCNTYSIPAVILQQNIFPTTLATSKTTPIEKLIYTVFLLRFGFLNFSFQIIPNTVQSSHWKSRKRYKTTTPFFFLVA